MSHREIRIDPSPANPSTPVVIDAFARAYDHDVALLMFEIAGLGRGSSFE